VKPDEIRGLFATAAEIAHETPPDLHGTAFELAVNLLLEDRSQNGRPGRPTRASALASARGLPPSRETGQNVPALFNTIDSSSYPQVHSGEKALDRALWVLRIGREALDLNAGLTAEDVASVLTNKFRVRTTRDSVRMAFDRAPTLVDRVQNDSDAASYRIMTAGDSYLDRPDDARGSRKARPVRRGR